MTRLLAQARTPIFFKIRRLLSVTLKCTTAIGCLAIQPFAAAVESNSSSYPVGIETNFSGIMFPEGATWLAYYSHYSAADSKDNSGKNNSSLAHYNFQSDTVALRLSYVWPGVKWLGANIESRFALSVPTVELELDIARPQAFGGPIDKGGTQTGFTDLNIAPVLFGWHGKTVHQTAGIEGYIPSGTYDKDEPVNIGHNFFQAAPFYAVTWFPNEHWEASAKFRYAFNSRNQDTDYQSGNEFTTEFSAGYRVSPAFTLGIQGYVYRQTTDDQLDGESVNGNGNRGSVNALGPYFQYRFSKSFAVITKYQQEFDAKNRGEGSRLWVQMKLPF
ncbi:transporter [Pseudomonas sp. NPDC087342]|uniref:SphA family protein n=1 Tax=Pseudomonas sp. NPDC087342 TaxID=3364437 RepID=UPI003816F9DD